MADLGASFNKSKYIIDNFERALKDGWIVVYFQPIVRTSNGRVCGEEALVRWEDPLLGMLNPMEFVPALEAVNLVHKLDLYVLDRTLEKMNEQLKRGLFLVPTSINISQVDYYACDIIEEVASRVEKANIAKRMIAIEVSEGSLSVIDDYLLSQLEQFQELGFQIWMDDYGSGNIAPALLQKFHFDTLKINMNFVRQIVDNDSSRIIITELIRLAMSLGIETVVEGVELPEQIEFLNEVGCSKVQGFYYCKPIPISDIFQRYTSGTAIGFENPKETDYYATIGKINLYDLSCVRTKDNNEINNYFDTLPMAIVEISDEKIRLIRGNKSFRDFMIYNFDNEVLTREYVFAEKKNRTGRYTMNSIRKCGNDGKRQIIDDMLTDGRLIQLLIQRVAVNSIKHVSAVIIVILSVTDKQKASEDLNYNYIARTLSEDYIILFYVNLDTDEYVEYSPDALNRDVSIERQGTDYFNCMRREFAKNVYKEDQEIMLESFTKEHILSEIDRKGTYSITYRRLQDNNPIYVNLKALRVRSGGNYILVGIDNVDAQMKQREMIEKIKEEQLTYRRIMALTGDFICIYSVDPETEEYVSFNSSDIYERLHINSTGKEFFEASRKNATKTIHPEDLQVFREAFTKENVLAEIEAKGMMMLKYRIMVDGEVMHICLRATMLDETKGPRLIVGILNIEEEVRREREYANSLLEAEDRAVKDQLTGVKNKRAYVDEEEHLNIQIKAGKDIKFAIVVCDLNGLKQINDTLGHKAGDEYIQEGCEIICDTFARSPVFRVGGDEFVAVAQGKDYDQLEIRLATIGSANNENKKNGKVTIAVGAAKYSSEDKFVSDVFERADSIMYDNKRKMKESVK